MRRIATRFINTVVSAGGVYSRGAPSTQYGWGFDSNDSIDYTSSSPFVVHAYGVGLGFRGFTQQTTTVRIHYADGTEVTLSIRIRKAISGSASC